MKPKKPQSNPDPVVVLKDADGTVTNKLYVLVRNQYMDSPVSRRTLEGPSIVHVDIRPTGTNCYEGNPDDKSTWEWIEQLMQVGYATLRGASND